MGLTTKEIENAKPDSKPYKLADAGGLCLLISPTGAKLWRWRYRFAGKEKMMALGEYLGPMYSLSCFWSYEVAVDGSRCDRFNPRVHLRRHGIEIGVINERNTS